MEINVEKHSSKEVVIKTQLKSDELTIRTSSWADLDDSMAHSIITMETGGARIHAAITPSEARQLASILNAHADGFEALQLALATVKEAA